MDDDEVSLRYDYSRLLSEGGRNALDQVEETVAARLNVRTVVNVVGRPEALRCAVDSLLLQRVSNASINSHAAPLTSTIFFAPLGSLINISAMGRPKTFTREAVLEKALAVFWRQGFADASLHELEQATGVNKSGLYAEFEDKEDLFVQSLRYYLENLEKQGLLTAVPLGWNNIERFLKLGPCSLEGQKGCFAISSMREFPILPPPSRLRGLPALFYQSTAVPLRVGDDRLLVDLLRVS